MFLGIYIRVFLVFPFLFQCLCPYLLFLFVKCFIILLSLVLDTNYSVLLLLQLLYLYNIYFCIYRKFLVSLPQREGTNSSDISTKCSWVCCQSVNCGSIIFSIIYSSVQLYIFFSLLVNSGLYSQLVGLRIVNYVCLGSLLAKVHKFYLDIYGVGLLAI